MEIPIGMPISMPVQVIATGRMPPLILRGTVTQFDGAIYSIDLAADATALAAGDALVLDLEGAPLVQGHVDSLFERALRVAVERTRPREPREFPRAEGDLRVRYHVAPREVDERALDAWVEHGRAPDDAAWRVPVHLVDWSASGLGFEDADTCRAGDRLLLELVPAEAAAPWRAVGLVIRAAPIGAEVESPAPAATHRFAVDLERAPPAVREGLLEHTIESQRLAGEDDAGADAP